MKASPHFEVAAVASCMLLTTACAVLQPKVDSTRFYVLRTLAESPETGVESMESEIPGEVRLGPGSLPNYLEPSGIAVEAGPLEVDYLDFHHWAEPLAKGLSRTLAENLERRLGIGRITVYPNPLLSGGGYEVQYTVNRFEGRLDGPVQLDATWRIKEVTSGTVLVTQRSQFVVPETGGAKEPDSYVERLSHAVTLWSQDIAIQIHRVAGTHGSRTGMR